MTLSAIAQPESRSLYPDSPVGKGKARLRAAARLGPWIAILILAALLRLPALPAALPYTSYVDEGHVLHRSVYMLSRGSCAADSYIYPPFPACAIAVATAAWAPIYRAVHGRPLSADLSPAPPRYFDQLSPAEMLIAGRALTLLAALATVWAAGRLAALLGGRAAGLAAALAAAVLPALVIRSSIVIVDTWATAFVTAALWAAERCRQDGPRPERWALAAGILAGLAGVAKYPSALVCLPVGLAALLAPGSLRQRLGRLGLAAAGAMATVAVAMPALVLRPAAVLPDLAVLSRYYRIQVMGSYWDQLTRFAEWDQPYPHPEAGLLFLIAAVAGGLAGLLDRRTAPAFAGFLLFAAALAAVLAPYPFRPLRNFLPLAPLAAVAAGVGFARLRRAFPRPRLLDLAGAAALAVLYLPPLAAHARERFAAEDSRHQAIEWLRPRLSPGERVLVAEELAVLPAEIERLPGQATVLPFRQAWRPLRHGRYDWAIVGLIPMPGGAPPPRQQIEGILAAYDIAAGFGRLETPPMAEAGRGNRQRLFILHRRAEAAATPTRPTAGEAPPRRR